MALHYTIEQMKYSKEYNHLISEHEARLIMGKLFRHFKVPKGRLLFTKHERGGGMATHTKDYDRGEGYLWCYKYTLPKKEMWLGIVLHEFAHGLACVKYPGCVHHTKKFNTQFKRVVNFARKKNYWGFGKSMLKEIEPISIASSINKDFENEN